MQPTNLLPNIDIQIFGEPAANEIYRKTVVAVIYQPQDQTYLCQYWKDYSGLTCLLSGGVEQNEDVVEALQREIGDVDLDAAMREPHAYCVD